LLYIPNKLKKTHDQRSNCQRWQEIPRMNFLDLQQIAESDSIGITLPVAIISAIIGSVTKPASNF